LNFEHHQTTTFVAVPSSHALSLFPVPGAHSEATQLKSTQGR
jgi:hypothetical protein